MKLYEVVISDDSPSPFGKIKFGNFGGGDSYYVEANSFDEAGLKALNYVRHQKEINDAVNRDSVLDSDGSLLKNENNEITYTVKNINVITEFLIK